MLKAAPPLALVAQHMGALAQSPLHCREHRGRGDPLPVAQQGVEIGQPEPGLKPAQIQQQLREKLLALARLEVRRQVAGEVGPFMGPPRRHLGPGPGAYPFMGVLELHGIGAGPGEAVVVLLAEPLHQGEVVEGVEPVGYAQKVFDLRQQTLHLGLAHRPGLAHRKDGRQLPSAQRLPLGAQHPQQSAHRFEVFARWKPVPEGIEVKALHAAGQIVEAIGPEGAIGAGQIVEHPHGVEKLAAALLEIRQPLRQLLRALAGLCQPRGQGFAAAAAEHVVVNVAEVAGLLGDQQIAAIGGVQRLAHLLAPAARGQHPQPGRKFPGAAGQQGHDRAAVAAGA